MPMPDDLDEPHTNEPIPTPGEDDSSILLSGETATTGTDEAQTENSPASGEPDHVNLTTPDGRAYWARHFQVTVEQMVDAVERVGQDPQRVAAHLGKPWPYEASGIV